jgi:hypothetical protein
VAHGVDGRVLSEPLPMKRRARKLQPA